MLKLLETIMWRAPAVGLAAGLASSCMYVVPPGSHAVIFDRFSGVLDEVKNERLCFRIPVIQTPFLYNTRTQAFAVACHPATRNSQELNLDLRILYRPKPEDLPTIHVRFKNNYKGRLSTVSNEVVQSVVVR